MTETKENAAKNPALELAEVELLEVEAAQQEIALEQSSESVPGVGNISLAGAIVHENTEPASVKIASWWIEDRHAQTKRDVNVVLDVRGGMWAQTFALVDQLRWMREDGHKVTILGMGTIQQQGLVLMQAADRRVMTPGSWASFTKEDFKEFVTNTANAKDMLKYLQDLERHGRQLIADRSASSVSAQFADFVTADRLETETVRGRLWWLSAKEARDLNLIDEIGVELHPVAAAPICAAVDTTLSLEQRRAAAELRKVIAKREFVRIKNSQTTSSPPENGIFHLYGPVGPGMLMVTELLLQRFHRLHPKAPIELWINTPGGSVKDGLAIIDLVQKLKDAGHKVTTVALGQAASMGAFIMQAGDERVIGKNAKLLIHRVSTMFGGNTDEMGDTQKHADLLEATVLPLLAARSQMTAAEIHAKSEHVDWWLTADEALKHGFVDRIR